MMSHHKISTSDKHRPPSRACADELKCGSGHPAWTQRVLVLPRAPEHRNTQPAKSPHPPLTLPYQLSTATAGTIGCDRPH